MNLSVKEKINVILYMATTLNGQIADLDHHTPWSSEEWQSYSQLVKQIGVIIIGRTTYELMNEGQDFAKIGNPLVIVVSASGKVSVTEKVKLASNITEAIRLAQELKFSSVLIGGGGKVNASALQENLISEIYLDVEPYIFGRGISLFSPVETNLKLSLLDTKLLNQNTIQLHYKVNGTLQPRELDTN